MNSFTQTTQRRLRARVRFDWADIRSDWPCLADLGQSVDGYAFQTREWIDAWSSTLGQDSRRKPVFVTLGDEGGERIFMPFAVRRWLGLRVLEGLGDGTVDYHAPLVARGTAFGPAEVKELWAALAGIAESPDVVHLAKLATSLADGPNPLLTRNARPYPMSGHVARLDGGWADWFDRRFGRETQKTLARKRRKLEELGPVETRYARDNGEALGWLEALIAGKAAQMEGRQSDNGLAAPQMADFYRVMTRHDSQSAHVKVYALTVDGSPVALQWGIVAGGRFTNLLTSYKSGEWTRFSPGLLMFRHLFEDCFAKGLRAFDFGLGDESYKLRFCDGPPVALCSVVRARSIGGLGYAATQSARYRLRNNSSARRLRQTLRVLTQRNEAAPALS